MIPCPLCRSPVLKIDIEGAEHDVLAQTPWQDLCVGNLLFELHSHPDFLPSRLGGDGGTNGGARMLLSDALPIFERLERAGFRHFMSEVVCPSRWTHVGSHRVNISTNCNGLVELAFVNVSWLRERHVEQSQGGAPR